MNVKTATLIALCSFMNVANGAVVLLGGWDGGSNDPKQSSTVSSFVTTTLSNTSPGGDVTNSFSQISSILWGTTDLDVDAATGQSPAELAIWNGATLLTLTLTVTNSGTNDLALDKIHWISKQDNPTSADTATITYTSGNLTDSTGANTVVAIPVSTTTPFDISLSGFLTDTTLSSGESATFTWEMSGGSGGNNRLDNFAISGSVIPEPSCLLLSALGSMLLLRRRR